MTVRQDDAVLEPSVNGVAAGEAPLQLSPLTISALMVTKADLVQALRVYLPNISDVEAIDADRFLLTVSGAADQDGSA